MKTVYTINELLKLLKQNKSKQVGLVPTMGFLHEGHLSLAEVAREENELVVMSIFVNPLQFGPNEDYDLYPRDEEADQLKAEQAGIDILFIPSVAEMYPSSRKLSLTFIEGADVLCGQTRPTHFDGVAMILSKLFNIIRPDKAYFGLKDAQQFAMVNTLVEQLNFQIDLIGLPTIRETDGLAKSSRNVYLSNKEREEASILHKCLETGQNLIKEGLYSPRKLEEIVTASIREQMSDGVIEYVTALSYPSLEQIVYIDQQIILAAAIQYDKARLIDNVIIMPNGKKRDKIILNHQTKG